MSLVGDYLFRSTLKLTKTALSDKKQESASRESPVNGRLCGEKAPRACENMPLRYRRFGRFAAKKRGLLPSHAYRSLRGAAIAALI